MNNLASPIFMTNDKHSIMSQHLTKRNISECLGSFGFVECAKMSRFLAVVVEDEIDISSYRYLLACLNDCLQTHAPGYKEDKSFAYFMPLVKLRDEIELISSVSGAH